MQVESTFGDEPYGMHLILTWLEAKLIYLPMSYVPTFLVNAVVYWSFPRTIKAL